MSCFVINNDVLVMRMGRQTPLTFWQLCPQVDGSFTGSCAITWRVQGRQRIYNGLSAQLSCVNHCLSSSVPARPFQLNLLSSGKFLVYIKL